MGLRFILNCWKRLENLVLSIEYKVLSTKYRVQSTKYKECPPSVMVGFDLK